MHHMETDRAARRLGPSISMEWRRLKLVDKRRIRSEKTIPRLMLMYRAASWLVHACTGSPWSADR